MRHGIHRVTSFEVSAPHTLRVVFDDGTSRVIDFSPLLEGELYGPLQDTEIFNSVRLDPETGTLVWSNGADFDPATLHDWPRVKKDLAAMARRWRSGERKHGTS